jgi:hypothetical protein
MEVPCRPRTANELAVGDYLYLAEVLAAVHIEEVSRHGDGVLVRWCGGTVVLAPDAPTRADLPAADVGGGG